MAECSGESAAISAALLWSFTALAFAEAAERVGAFALNVIRLSIALALILATHVALYGCSFADASPTQFGYLAVSGMVGLGLGDLAYFRSLVLLGPTAGALLMTLWPVFAGAIGWIWLGEKLDGTSIAGIALSLGGVAWAIGAQNAGVGSGRSVPLGVACGLLGAFGQALGLALSKKGLQGMEHELSGSLIRTATSCFFMWAFAVVGRPLRGPGPDSLAGAAANGRVLSLVAFGAATGPFLGVWLSLYAATHGDLGVVSTLMATTPLWIMLQAALFRKERPGLHRILGGLVALAGVAILFNRERVAEMVPPL